MNLGLKFWMGILSLTLITSCASQSQLMGGDWKTLFDSNSNLNGWTRVGDGNWRIQDGAIQADFVQGKDASFLVSKNRYKDYEIYVELWVDDQTNTGIFNRCESATDVSTKTCYEFNVWDTRPDPTYGTGAIVDLGKVSPPYPKAGGKWNTLELTLMGSQMEMRMNGQLTAKAVDSTHKEGHVALQFGSGIVKFRKVLIRGL